MIQSLNWNTVTAVVVRLARKRYGDFSDRQRRFRRRTLENSCSYSLLIKFKQFVRCMSLGQILKLFETNSVLAQCIVMNGEFIHMTARQSAVIMFPQWFTDLDMRLV